MKRRSLLALALTALAMLFALTACASTNQNTTNATELSSMPKIEGITYHGDVPKNPKKLVNFAYSYTGYLLQLGIDVSSYSLANEKDNPAFGDKLKDAVQLTADDTEAIAAQEPDLIIVFAGNDNIDKLKEIAPVIEITYGKADYLQMMTDLGQIFDKEEEAQAWLNAWEQKVADAKNELQDVVSTDTTFTILDFFDKQITVYGDNFGRGGELIYDALGFAAPQAIQTDVIDKDGWLSISQEKLPTYAGDYLVMDVKEDTKEAAASLKESDIYQNLEAVKNNHVLELDHNLFYFSDPMSLDQQIDVFVKTLKDTAGSN